MTYSHLALIISLVLIAAALTVSFLVWLGGGEIDPRFLIPGLAGAALLRLWRRSKP